MALPVTVTISTPGDGRRYRAEVVGAPGNAFEADSLKELFHRLQAAVSEALEFSDEDRDDIAVARARLAEIEEQGAIAWDTIKRDLQL